MPVRPVPTSGCINVGQVCDSLTVLVAACAAFDGVGIARNAATAFDVFFWLQVRNFDVSLFHSAPNGPDHIDIRIFVLCLHDQLFRSSVRFRMAN